MFKRTRPKWPIGAKREIFHSVSVETNDQIAICTPVAPLVGQRFLAEDAPRIPVEGCTNPDCRCRYVHYRDRRTESRRDSDHFIAVRKFHNPDLRSGSGRRVSDE